VAAHIGAPAANANAAADAVKPPRDRHRRRFFRSPLGLLLRGFGAMTVATSVAGRV
jgi:hypothetical protein